MCKLNFTLSPNPANEQLKITLNESENRINGIKINSIDNPSIENIVEIRDPQSEIIISVGQYQTGYYTVSIRTKNKKIYSAIFFKK